MLLESHQVVRGLGLRGQSCRGAGRGKRSGRFLKKTSISRSLKPTLNDDIMAVRWSHL